MSRYDYKRNPPPVLVVEEWKNNIGQVIQPGDDIIIVTTCTSRTAIKRGVYRGTKNKNVSATAIENRMVGYKVKETGERISFTEYNKRATDYCGAHPPYDYSDRTWRDRYNVWQTKYVEFSGLHDSVYEDAPRNTVLQLNRIYKIDTSVFELKL